MNLFLTIFSLLATLFIFLWLCKTIGIDVDNHLSTIFSNLGGNPNGQPGVPIPQAQPQFLAKQFSSEYADFAVMVLSCLRAVGHSCGLIPPSYASGIFCPKLADRVRLANGYIIFVYDLPLDDTFAIRDGRLSRKAVDIDRVRETLQETLPDYIEDGYYFNGTIRVRQIESGSVRVDVAGVGRVFI